MLPELTPGSTTKSPRGPTRLHQPFARPSRIWYTRARVNPETRSPAGRCARTGILKPLTEATGSGFPWKSETTEFTNPTRSKARRLVQAVQSGITDRTGTAHQLGTGGRQQTTLELVDLYGSPSRLVSLPGTLERRRTVVAGTIAHTLHPGPDRPRARDTALECDGTSSIVAHRLQLEK